jgi:hypothetical protein
VIDQRGDLEERHLAEGEACGQERPQSDY